VSESDEFIHELRVRYSECDAQGIVFNARWFEYFDIAMTEFWREVVGGYSHLPDSLGVETVVAETGARFRGAGRFDDLLSFVIHVRRIGTSSMRIEVDGLREGALLCEGFIEYVFVDPRELVPVEIPERLIELLPDATASA
jgi:acyl-CoA thioester hydrolase